jgi:ribosomal protein S18 acetylase RimI-like enzyme
MPPGVSDTEEGLSRLLAQEPDGLLIAESRGQAVGALIAVWDGWRGSFYRLAVHADSRRQGLATALLREGERRLRARGAVRLTAIVADDDPGAMDFWRSVGYERQPDRVRFVRHLRN